MAEQVAFVSRQINLDESSYDECMRLLDEIPVASLQLSLRCGATVHRLNVGASTWLGDHAPTAPPHRRRRHFPVPRRRVRIRQRLGGRRYLEQISTHRPRVRCPARTWHVEWGDGAVNVRAFRLAPVHLPIQVRSRDFR